MPQNRQPKSGGYAVLTGAAGGLGQALARELAGKGFSPILIDLPGTGLREQCAGIQTAYGVDCRFYECDLTDKDQLLQITLDIGERFPVTALVNNAGTGGSIRFRDADPEHLDRMIRLNATAVTLLIRYLLPVMEQQPQAYILNVGSLSAFTPNGYKSVYPASKGFVYMLSRGLYHELRGTNVHISVVNPGPMPTNPDAIRRIRRQGIFARLSMHTPQKVARKSIDGMLRGRFLIFPDTGNRIQWLLTRVLPETWITGFMSRVVHRELTEGKRQ